MNNPILSLVKQGTFTEEEVLSATKEIEVGRSSIIVPGKDRPDLLVSVDKYHHGKTWEEAHRELNKDSYFMLAPKYFVEFLNHLRSGKPVYNGRGKEIDSSNVNPILDEILTVRDPWKAEWLDARFGKNTITYHKIKTDGTIGEVTEPLGDCLMENRNPGMDLDSWLRNPTEQGLPRKDTAKGSLYYWYPKKDTVAGFRASSDGVLLYCRRSPQGLLAALGVRRAKIFEK